MCERESVCVCEREIVCERDRECVCVCVSVRLKIPSQQVSLEIQ